VEIDLDARRNDYGVVHVEAGTDELREAPAEDRRRFGNIESRGLRSSHIDQSRHALGRYTP